MSIKRKEMRKNQRQPVAAQSEAHRISCYFNILRDAMHFAE